MVTTLIEKKKKKIRILTTWPITACSRQVFTLITILLKGLLDLNGIFSFPVRMVLWAMDRNLFLILFTLDIQLIFMGTST